MFSEILIIKKGESMEGLNKFKVLTITIVLLFVFVVAAIYSNTKDASQLKAKNNLKAEKANFKKDIQASMDNVPNNSSDITELQTSLENLNARVDELSNKLNETHNGICKIYGILRDDGVEQLSSEAAIEEARDNNRELVMTCSF